MIPALVDENDDEEDDGFGYDTGAMIWGGVLGEVRKPIVDVRTRSRRLDEVS